MRIFTKMLTTINTLNISRTNKITNWIPNRKEHRIMKFDYHKDGVIKLTPMNQGCINNSMTVFVVKHKQLHFHFASANEHWIVWLISNIWYTNIITKYCYLAFTLMVWTTIQHVKMGIKKVHGLAKAHINSKNKTMGKIITFYQCHLLNLILAICYIYCCHNNHWENNAYGHAKPFTCICSDYN